MLTVEPTYIPDVLLLTPQVHQDARGSFLEHYNARVFQQATGIQCTFVQDNLCTSVNPANQHVLRGLHYQQQYPQGKLISALQGCIWDVAVDLRTTSATYGQHVTLELQADLHQQLWIPPGFAHGYIVLSDTATVHYKVTEYWQAADEHTLLWNDPALDIPWPIFAERIMLSDKDRNGKCFAEVPKF